MNVKEKIDAFVEIGTLLNNENSDLEEIIHKTEMHNPWFTKFFCGMMLESFREKFFTWEKISEWVENYDLTEEKNKTIGLVLAGNVPFVGMHDVLCVLMSGNNALIKLSSKDMFFFPWFHQQLIKINPEFASRIKFAERLENFDAVIATGSNNSARYFKYYFGKYPHIIRKNRTSVAILNGLESESELQQLGKDVFYYFGLGCRNVSKFFVPDTYDLEILFRNWENFRYISENTKYNNNFDYNRAILLLNQTEHLCNDFFMIRETEELFSPISILFCERYSDENDLAQKINGIAEHLQCVVSNTEGNTKFGVSQYPELWNYADNIDTMKFCLELK